MTFQYPRTPRETLLTFDPASKRCTMNCGQHGSDPRSRTEMMFQCEDCETLSDEELGLAVVRSLSHAYEQLLKLHGRPPTLLRIGRKAYEKLKPICGFACGEEMDSFMGCKLEVCDESK